MSANLFSIVGASLCPSVGTLLNTLTDDPRPFRQDAFEGTFRGCQLTVRNGGERDTYVEIVSDRRRLVFRTSQRIPSLYIAERHEFGEFAGSISVSAFRQGKHLYAMNVIASLGRPPNFEGDPHLFVMPRFTGDELELETAFEITDDPGSREVDFHLTSDPTRGFVETGLQKGYILTMTLNDPMRGVLRTVGLEECTRIELYGFQASTLVALTEGLRLVFYRDSEPIQTFPPRSLPGAVFSS